MIHLFIFELYHSRYLFNGSSKLSSGPRRYGQSLDPDKGKCKQFDMNAVLPENLNIIKSD